MRVTGQGEDNSGAGRWVWQDLLGTKGSKIRIVTAYCPVKNESSLGSTWNQQTTLGPLFVNPIDKFVTDLTTELELCLDLGLHLLLMIDANQDVRSSILAKKLGQLGLQEVVSKCAGARGTQMRGSIPIDGIFGSALFLNGNLSCGYTICFSDHLCLWLDLPKSILLDTKDPPSKGRPRRLQNTDPRTVRRYLEAYTKQLRSAHMFEKVHT
jgi:hypothetical protein